ncbi:MAG TPA: hypothetical protein PK079_08195 [Leptospiraceae bacterium]|nr:hypothetical protein [Leptospiraceae bacterium]HMW06307.1 hypothetical protein [Leptospiraceae bacterium]HMX31014.1 hypothetical protein [Leptospiraceae bacterium]HMY32167.1 hypothetical protein [Leptospiraceae bacterium]HMZ65104.1 hypothetical protein [Leptospiraceae bacterium]
MNKDNEYIKVESISEIQNNLKVDLLNKKFQDKDGNRFVVRFGNESRKLEILRIITKSELESGHIGELETKNEPSHDHKIDLEKEREVEEQKQKENLRQADRQEINSKFNEDSGDGFGDIDLNIEAVDTVHKKVHDHSLINPRSAADERRYIFDLLKAIDKNKDRVVSILTNVQNSRIYELTGDPSENKNIISNFTREFEGDIFRILENLQNKFKEITSFPKTTHHYSMNYTVLQKDFLAKLETDKAKFDYILRWDFQEPTLILIKKFAKMVTDLLNVLNKKEEDQIKTLSFQQQTLFRDAKIAGVYCLNDLDFLKRSVESWKESAV